MNPPNEIQQYAGYIRELIQKHVPIVDKEFLSLLPYLEIRKFGRRDKVLRVGEKEEYINLVVKGLLRKFAQAGKNEKTFQLGKEGDVVHSDLSFYRRTPSMVAIEALEDSVLVSLTHEHFQQALQIVPPFEQVVRELMTSMFIERDQRYHNHRITTTRERFLEYHRSNPMMVDRVPQKILASYLEIKPETFSRLKHLLKK